MRKWKRTHREGPAGRGSSSLLWLAGAIAIAGIAIAFAIGLGDHALTDYQLRFAQFGATIAGGAGVIISAIRYIWERQEELAWEKTKFMIDLFREFEAESRLRRAQELIDDAQATGDQTHLTRILGDLAGLDEDEINDRRAIDRYLDFFDHLYTYIFITRTLRPQDATSFSGYMIDVLDSEAVSEFAFRWGYEDVLKLAIHFRDQAEQELRAEEADRLRDEVVAKRRR